MELVAVICIPVFIVEVILIVAWYIYCRMFKVKKFRDNNAEPPEIAEPWITEIASAELHRGMEIFFQTFAKVVLKSPFVVILVAAAYGAMIPGMNYLEITTDPVSLWANPTSQTRMEKAYFDEKFTPFYRTTQVIIKPSPDVFKPYNFTHMDPASKANTTYTFGPALNPNVTLAIMDLVLRINNLKAEHNGKIVKLEDVCLQPMAPVKKYCSMMTVANYFQNNMTTLKSSIEKGTYDSSLTSCISNPTQPQCFGAYGGPVLPYTALGGFLPEGAIASLSKDVNYYNATATIITLPLNNYNNRSKLGPAFAWEEQFLDLMKSYKIPNMKIAFNAERGIEDEITRETSEDLPIVAISYLMMFLYITLALSNFNSNCTKMMVESKVVLGFLGVALVLAAVCAGIGLCAYLGVEATLFVIEVLPFLVLAVG